MSAVSQSHFKVEIVQLLTKFERTFPCHESRIRFHHTTEYKNWKSIYIAL